jgi:hypothetical protein
VFAVVLAASCAAAWDINDPNAPLDGSVTGASTSLLDDVTIINDVDPAPGSIDGASTSGSGTSSTPGATVVPTVISSSSGNGSGGGGSSSTDGVVTAAGAGPGSGEEAGPDVSSTGDSKAALQAATDDNAATPVPVKVGVVVGGVGAALGIVVGGLALLRRAAVKSRAALGASATACTAAMLEGGTPQRPASTDSGSSETRRLRIIHVDVDDDEMEV